MFGESFVFVCLSTLFFINCKSTSSKTVEPFKPAMEQFDLQHSAKDIPAPCHKVYLNMLINSIEAFMFNLEWRVILFLNPAIKTAKNTFNFKTNKRAEKVPQLDKFKKEFCIHNSCWHQSYLE